MTARAVYWRGTVDGSSWQIASRVVPGALGDAVRWVHGYDEASDVPVQRLELPSPRVVVIVELGPPLRAGEVGSIATARPGGFVVAPGGGAVRTEHDGRQHGLEIALRPGAALPLLGVALHELAGGPVALRDLLRGDERSLPERIVQMDDWDRRLDEVERWLAARWRGARPCDPRVAWAVAALEGRGGAGDIEGLRREVGLSRRHFASLFRDHVGVTPKRYARLLRFERLVFALRSPGRPSWSRLARELGYFDQAHLCNDVRALVDMTPTLLRDSIQRAPTVA